MKKIFAFAFIALALSAVSCKKDKQPSEQGGDPGGTDKPVVNILQDEYELEVGDEFDMTAHLTVDGPEGVDQSVVWTSTDSEVAFIEDNKIITKKAGTATLKAAAVQGDEYDDCLVTVYDKPTGVQLIRDGAALSENDPVEFEFSEEVTFEVKVLPATAKQDNWCLEAADDGDKISDYFEISGMDTNSPKFKAIKDGIIRINLCYGKGKTVAEYFEFWVSSATGN